MVRSKGEIGVIADSAFSNATAANLSYLWRVPERHISVQLSLEVVDRLGLSILEGFQSPSRRGMETGGLLLGRARRNQGAIVVEVDGFEPLACEHAAGPSFLLSASDREALEERIRSRKSRGLSVVGFYRSHTRKDFIASMEDVWLMSAYFSEPSNVLLLIQADRNGPSTAGFVIWEGRETLSMTPYAEFPFRRAALTAGGHEIRSNASTLQPVRKERAVTRPTLEFPQFPQKELVLAVAKRLLRMPQLPRVPQIPAALAGDLQKWRANLKLEWLAVAAGAAAVVILAIGLLVSILSRGTVPAVASVPRSMPVAESLPQTPNASPPPEEIVAPITPAPAPEAPIPIAAPGAELPRTSAPRRSPDEIKPFKPVATAATPRNAPSLPDLPPLAASSGARAFPDPPEIAARLPGAEALASRTPAIPDSFVSVTMDPLPDSRSGGFLHKVLGNRPKRTDFAPPTEVHRAPTNVPPELRRRIQRDVAVDVKVYVDRTGKVSYAELLSNGTGADRDLASLAVFSSRRWQFAPAHLGDETVPAEVVLHFRFGPAAP